RGAPVSVEGPACCSLLPAQVWLSDMPLDRCRNQQAGGGLRGRRGGPGGHRAGGGRAEGVQGRRVFQRMYTAISVVPAAMGKKVRDVAAKAKADGVEGNFSGDLLQSGGMLIVAKGT
ncbi:unnamed protein product, partial [Tetraodon nigroviridis]